jgi:alkyl hydroperoxide reductase subunit AhpC
VYSHIAWVRNIEEKAGVAIPFPAIADLDRKVATAYGMVMPGESTTKTSRCVFVIDPGGILRAMICYPLAIPARRRTRFARRRRSACRTRARPGPTHAAAGPQDFGPFPASLRLP